MAGKKQAAKKADDVKRTPPPATDDVVRSVRLPKATHRRLKQLAFDKEIDMQDFILQALENALVEADY